MQTSNPLQMNDWEIKKFIRIILALQLSLLGIICLGAIGIRVPIARQFVGFIYLTFVPGVILLRILKIHKIGNIETIMYTVGLSIATVMFSGAFINAVFPLLGIFGPISTVPLVFTIGAVVLVLCIVCYFRDKDFQNTNFIDFGDILSPAVLFLFLIPFMAIFGTYAANFYHISIILVLMLILISAIAVLIAFDAFISRKMFPFAILIFAISLILHNSLISMHVCGWDINLELYLCNLVKTHSYWDPTLDYTANGMLSLVMLAPIYSSISDLSITWVFKIVYPFLFCLVPLGLYRIVEKQTDDRIAFISCLFFVSVNVFYTEMMNLARQQIAELFLVLLILSMIDKNMNKPKRAFLFIIFSISLAVSHYGLSYIFMGCLILAWIMLVLAESPKMQKIMRNFFSSFGGVNDKLFLNPNFINTEYRTINSTFVLLFITFTLTWYLSISNSSAFDAIANIGEQILSSISTDFLDPNASQGLEMVTAKSAPGVLHDINKTINYLNQIFIIIGAVVLSLKFQEFKFKREYMAFSLLNLGICFAGVTVPFFASALHMTRLYHITLIFLAPFCVIGGIAVIWGVFKVVGISWTNRLIGLSVKILSIYFAIFLLYQSGLVFELTEGSGGSISLNSTVDYPRFNDREFAGASWLNNVRDNRTTFSDENRWQLLNSFNWSQKATYEIASYIYLGTINIVSGSILMYSWKKVSGKTYNVRYEPLIKDRNMIYSNGGAQIYCR